MTTDIPLYQGMCAVLVAVASLTALWRLDMKLRSSRPYFDVRPVLAVALAARLAAIAFTALLGLGERIRSTDDADFLTKAVELGNTSLVNLEWLRTAVGELPVIPWAVMLKVLGDPGDIPLRVFQVSLETAGLALFAAVAYDLGGRLAALICAWIIALEPSNVFFATLLHDEALATVGAGAFLLGLINLYRSGVGWTAGSWIVAGLVLAVGTRPYIAAALVLTLIASLVHRQLRARLSPHRATALMACAIAGGTVLAFGAATTAYPSALRSLQEEHDHVYEFANLDLGDVNVTTTGGLIETLAVRSADLVTRPFPWQLENTSQQLGAAATTIWYLLLVCVCVLGLRSRRLLPRGWLALAYCFLFQAAGFALTLVNAALGFRHRIHLMMLVACLLAVLVAISREDRRVRPEAR